jgi:uncharacterized protein
MKNRIKKLFCLTVALLLVMALPLAVAAEHAPVYFLDEAILLKDANAFQVYHSLFDISNRLNISVAIHTVNSLKGDDIGNLAMRHYNKSYFNGYTGGVLLLVAMEEREWYIYTTGDAFDFLTDAALDDIEDAIVPLLSEGDYYEAFMTYASLCDKYLTMGQEGNIYHGTFPWGQNIVIALIIGAVVGLIVVSSMQAQLKSVRPRREAHEYTRPGSMNVTRSRDLFLYRTVSRRPKPKDSSSGRSGGSSSGGRGGRF